MSQENPFAAPSESFDPAQDTSGRFILADRSTRLVAAIVDSLLALAYTIPLLMGFGVVEKNLRGESTLGLTILVTAIGLVIFLALHGYFLAKNGQSLGKKLLGIRIANMQGKNPGLAHIFLARLLPVSAVTLIPVIGTFLPLVDVLPVFGSERRCVHDLIAGTQVLKV